MKYPAEQFAPLVVYAALGACTPGAIVTGWMVRQMAASGWAVTR